MHDARRLPWKIAALAPLLVLVPAAARAAGEGGPPAVDHLLAERGAALFRTHCAVCHGLDGRGEGPAAPALRQRPADLTAIATRDGGRFDDARIARVIDGRFDAPAHGSREMPVWGARLGDDVPERELAEEFVRGRIQLLVEHLRSLQEPPLSERQAPGSGS